MKDREASWVDFAQVLPKTMWERTGMVSKKVDPWV